MTRRCDERKIFSVQRFRVSKFRDQAHGAPPIRGNVTLGEQMTLTHAEMHRFQEWLKQEAAKSAVLITVMEMDLPACQGMEKENYLVAIDEKKKQFEAVVTVNRKLCAYALERTSSLQEQAA